MFYLTESEEKEFALENQDLLINIYLELVLAIIEREETKEEAPPFNLLNKPEVNGYSLAADVMLRVFSGKPWDIGIFKEYGLEPPTCKLPIFALPCPAADELFVERNKKYLKGEDAETISKLLKIEGYGFARIAMVLIFMNQPLDKEEWLRLSEVENS